MIFAPVSNICYYSYYCSGRTTVTLATPPMCERSSSLLGWRQLCQWCLPSSQDIFHLYSIFRIFHNAMQSISNITEIKSRNIHNHVFLLQSSRKSVRSLPLVGRKTFWPEDFLGGGLRRSSEALSLVSWNLSLPVPGQTGTGANSMHSLYLLCQ